MHDPDIFSFTGPISPDFMLPLIPGWNCYIIVCQSIINQILRYRFSTSVTYSDISNVHGGESLIPALLPFTNNSAEDTRSPRSISILSFKINGVNYYSSSCTRHLRNRILIHQFLTSRQDLFHPSRMSALNIEE